MDQDEILLDAEERMDKAVQLFHSQLQGLRTGRATPGLVDSIRVEYYGSPTPLKQVANISVPEPQQIVSLFAYLADRKQSPILASKENQEPSFAWTISRPVVRSVSIIRTGWLYRKCLLARLIGLSKRKVGSGRGPRPRIPP
jgi:hypothetical protein